MTDIGLYLRLTPNTIFLGNFLTKEFLSTSEKKALFTESEIGLSCLLLSCKMRERDIYCPLIPHLIQAAEDLTPKERSNSKEEFEKKIKKIKKVEIEIFEFFDQNLAMLTYYDFLEQFLSMGCISTKDTILISEPAISNSKPLQNLPLSNNNCPSSLGEDTSCGDDTPDSNSTPLISRRITRLKTLSTLTQKERLPLIIDIERRVLDLAIQFSIKFIPDATSQRQLAYIFLALARKENKIIDYNSKILKEYLQVDCSADVVNLVHRLSMECKDKKEELFHDLAVRNYDSEGMEVVPQTFLVARHILIEKSTKFERKSNLVQQGDKYTPCSSSGSLLKGSSEEEESYTETISETEESSDIEKINFSKEIKVFTNDIRDFTKEKNDEISFIKIDESLLSKKNPVRENSYLIRNHRFSENLNLRSTIQTKPIPKDEYNIMNQPTKTSLPQTTEDLKKFSEKNFQNKKKLQLISKRSDCNQNRPLYSSRNQNAASLKLFETKTNIISRTATSNAVSPRKTSILSSNTNKIEYPVRRIVQPARIEKGVITRQRSSRKINFRPSITNSLTIREKDSLRLAQSYQFVQQSQNNSRIGEENQIESRINQSLVSIEKPRHQKLQSLSWATNNPLKNLKTGFNKDLRTFGSLDFSSLATQSFNRKIVSRLSQTGANSNWKNENCGEQPSGFLSSRFYKEKGNNIFGKKGELKIDIFSKKGNSIKNEQRDPTRRIVPSLLLHKVERPKFDTGKLKDIDFYSHRRINSSNKTSFTAGQFKTEDRGGIETNIKTKILRHKNWRERVSMNDFEELKKGQRLTQTKKYF